MVSEHLASNYFPFTNDELSKEKSKFEGERRNVILPVLKNPYNSQQAKLSSPFPVCLS